MSEEKYSFENYFKNSLIDLLNILEDMSINKFHHHNRHQFIVSK